MDWPECVAACCQILCDTACHLLGRPLPADRHDEPDEHMGFSPCNVDAPTVNDDDEE